MNSLRGHSSLPSHHRPSAKDLNLDLIIISGLSVFNLISSGTYTLLNLYAARFLHSCFSITIFV